MHSNAAKPLRAAVIGCGAIADRLHVPDYVHCDEADLVALCDISTDAARRVSERWRPDVRIYKDYREMLKKEPLDCVTVTLPNALHCEVTVECLKAGLHTMVEKPMATSDAECKKMIAAAKKAEKLLLVNQTQRLVNAHVKAREVVRSGILGGVLYVNAVFGHDGPDNWSPDAKWFFDKKKARFGAMADLGVHKADLVRYITGKEVKHVSAYTARLEKGGSVEDNFVSCLTFADGAVGTLAASWTFKGLGANFMVLQCEKGSLRITDWPDKPVVAHFNDPFAEINFAPDPAVELYPESWGVEVSKRFARACLGLEQPFCTGEEGRRSLGIIFAAEKSAQTGKSITIKD